MTPLPTRRVQVSRTITGYLEASHPWQYPDDPDGYNGVAVATMAKIKSARATADGRRTVHLTTPEREALDKYIATMESGAADNASEAWARGELCAARALRRQIAKASI